MAGTKLLFFREGLPVDVGEGPERLSVLIDAECRRLMRTSRGPTLTRSEWIQKACVEKLKHNRRSRGKRPLRPGASDAPQKRAA
jgi:hypothetical protein